MPLDERNDYTDSKYCGLLVSRPTSVEAEVDNVARSAGFDFVASPLASKQERVQAPASALEYPDHIRHDLVADPDALSGKVVGCVSAWVDLDSRDPVLRRDSRAAFVAETRWAQFAGLQAIVLPAPHSSACCANYAQVRFGRKRVMYWNPEGDQRNAS